MSKYLLIASRDPSESGDISHYYDLATQLAKSGNDVTCFLVQNGVLPARRGHLSAGLSAMAAAGVEVLADDFSLRERGITAGNLATGVKAAPLDTVIDQLAEGRKALWH